MAPQLATRGWTWISTRWLYLGPVGADYDAVGRPTGTRGREQNRNTRMWGTRGEKARRRIEIRIDPRKSSGTRPIFGYSCDRSSFSLFSALLLPLCSCSFSSRVFRFLCLIGPSQLPPISSSFTSSKTARFLTLDFLFRRNP